MTLMCSMPVDFQTLNRTYGIDFATYFEPELERLQTFTEADLMRLDDKGISITPKGRLFVRVIGMVFDKYLGQPTVSTYSKLLSAGCRLRRHDFAHQSGS